MVQREPTQLFNPQIAIGFGDFTHLRFHILLMNIDGCGFLE